MVLAELNPTPNLLLWKACFVDESTYYEDEEGLMLDLHLCYYIDMFCTCVLSQNENERPA